MMHASTVMHHVSVVFCLPCLCIPEQECEMDSERDRQTDKGK
jgi:hypothetical protein